MASAGGGVLRALNPLVKLGVCLVWLIAAVLVFNPDFQAATILVIALVLILVNRNSPATILALMVPFALFGFAAVAVNAGTTKRR